LIHTEYEDEPNSNNGHKTKKTDEGMVKKNIEISEVFKKVLKALTEE
jgi:hypothetical protein